MIRPKKALRKFGRDIKDVLIVSKQAVRHESPILIKEGVKELKKRVKIVKYKKRRLGGMRKQLGYGRKINLPDKD